ncbi:MAG: hypothetical protein WBA28_00740 [Microbacteriaceae bacterium]
MDGSKKIVETTEAASRRRARHGRSGRSMVSATRKLSQPSREADFAKFAGAAFDELRQLWPKRLAPVSIAIVMAPNPGDPVVGQGENGKPISIDWRVDQELNRITLFRARIENTVRRQGDKEPYLLQLQVEEALCRSVAEYLGVEIVELLHGEH